jgi:hypothetical protein
MTLVVQILHFQVELFLVKDLRFYTVVEEAVADLYIILLYWVAVAVAAAVAHLFK